MTPLDFDKDYCWPKDMYIDVPEYLCSHVTYQYLVLPDRQLLVGDEYKGATFALELDGVKSNHDVEPVKDIRDHPDFALAHLLVCITTFIDTSKSSPCYTACQTYTIVHDDELSRNLLLRKLATLKKA